LNKPPYRIVADNDFDGLISAVLLQKIFPEIKRIVFATPKMIKNGTYLTYPADIIADLPRPKKYFAWYDHHPGNKPSLTHPNEYWDGECKSCARLIFITHRNEFAKKDMKKIMELVNAADKIDSAEFTPFNKPSPESMISLTLLTGNKTRDIPYKNDLLKMLQEGTTLKEISKTQRIQDAYAYRMEQLQKEKDGMDVTFRTKYGEKFAVINENGKYISKAAVFKLFSDNPALNYAIKLRQVQQSRTLLSISANIYKKQNNNINLYKFVKEKGGCGSPDIASYTIQTENVLEETKKLMKEIATLSNLAPKCQT